MLNGNFEVEFEIGHEDYTALIDENANLIQYKHEIHSTALPETVTNTIQENYADYHIEDAEELVIGKTSYYQVELEGSILEKHLVFTSAGKETDKVNYWD